MEMKVSVPDIDTLPEHTKIESMIPLSAMSDEEFRKLCASILVVVPYRESDGIHPGVAMHFGIWARVGIKYSCLKDPHGGFVEIVRGHMERAFTDMAQANPEIRYMVMIDNDEAIEWDAPLRLARHDKPVVSGVVCGFNPERGIFACFTAEDEKGVPRFPSFRFTKVFPGKGLKKVHQVGTGLCCIRRDVFETIVEKGEHAFMIDDDLRRESYRVGHIKQGEDFSFCDKVRKAGFDIWVDFSVRALHYKTIALGWPDELVDEDLDGNDWKVSSLDFRGLKHVV